MNPYIIIYEPSQIMVHEMDLQRLRNLECMVKVLGTVKSCSKLYMNPVQFPHSEEMNRPFEEEE